MDYNSMIAYSIFFAVIIITGIALSLDSLHRKASRNFLVSYVCSKKVKDGYEREMGSLEVSMSKGDYVNKDYLIGYLDNEGLERAVITNIIEIRKEDFDEFQRD